MKKNKTKIVKKSVSLPMSLHAWVQKHAKQVGHENFSRVVSEAISLLQKRMA